MNTLFGTICKKLNSRQIYFLKSNYDYHYKQVVNQDIHLCSKLVVNNIANKSVNSKIHYRDLGVMLVHDTYFSNRDELINMFDLPAKASDSDILVRGYKRRGKNILDVIRGDFSFGIYDIHKRQLFCARDPMGIRPLFYHIQDKCLVFFSKIASYIDIFDAIPDEEWVMAFLEKKRLHGTRTCLSGVKRLMPGTAMVFSSRDGLKSWRYWHPENVQELRLSHNAEYEKAFRRVFSKSLKRNIEASGKASILLSGGIDSSSIAATLEHHKFFGLHEKVYTYTKTFSGLPEEIRKHVDETEFVSALVEGSALNSTYLQCDKLSPLSGVEELVYQLGSPFVPRGHYSTNQVLKVAYGDGVTLMVDGSEGDITVGYGYDYFSQLAEEGQWSAFSELAHQHANNVRYNSPESALRKLFYDYGMPVIVRKIKRGALISAFMHLKAASRHLNLTLNEFLYRAAVITAADTTRPMRIRFRPNPSPKILSREALESIEEFDNLVDSERTDLSHIESRASALTNNPMLREALEAADGVYRMNKIEGRHPFFDRHVIEFCLSLPPRQRMEGGWTRSIVRRALADYLPQVIRERVGKANLGLNMVHTLQHESSDAIEFVRNTNFPSYVDSTKVRRSIDLFFETPKAATMQPILRLYAVAVWLPLLRGRAQ